MTVDRVAQSGSPSLRVIQTEGNSWRRWSRTHTHSFTVSLEALVPPHTHSFTVSLEDLVPTTRSPSYWRAWFPHLFALTGEPGPRHSFTLPLGGLPPPTHTHSFTLSLENLVPWSPPLVHSVTEDLVPLLVPSVTEHHLETLT